MVDETRSGKVKSGMSKKVLGMVTLLMIILISVSASAVYFWNDAQSAKSKTPEAVAEKNVEESQRVISALDKILLTESEGAPTVARVEDADVLREANEDFYKHAKNGDYLVLYPQRAIIFREADDLVINVAPIINTDQLKKTDTTNTETKKPAEEKTEN